MQKSGISSAVSPKNSYSLQNGLLAHGPLSLPKEWLGDVHFSISKKQMKVAPQTEALFI